MCVCEENESNGAEKHPVMRRGGGDGGGGGSKCLHSALQHVSHTHMWTHSHIHCVCNKESRCCVHTAASGLLPAALWGRNCLVYVHLSESKSISFTAPFFLFFFGNRRFVDTDGYKEGRGC